MKLVLVTHLVKTCLTFTLTKKLVEKLATRLKFDRDAIIIISQAHAVP